MWVCGCGCKVSVLEYIVGVVWLQFLPSTGLTVLLQTIATTARVCLILSTTTGFGSPRLEGVVRPRGLAKSLVKMNILPFAFLAQPDACLLRLLRVRHALLVHVLRQAHIGNASCACWKERERY